MLSHFSFAQDKSLSANSFWQIVQSYHPIVRQAVIGIEKSNAQLLVARGAFDPILMHTSAEKTLDGKNYIDYHAPALNIPTWYGIELSAGIENIRGSRLDPSQTLGQTSYLGISIPVAKNLVMDKRRAALKQAKIMQKSAVQDQRTLLNQLLLEAMDAYFIWSKNHQLLQISQNNLKNASNRLDFVRRGVALGERPGMDTLEALTQKQLFENQVLARSVAWSNSGIELSVFMWNQQSIPVDLPQDITPSGTDDATMLANLDLNLSSLLDKARSNHPELNAYRFKLASLDIEKKLKFQNLLPKLDLSYNHLSKGGPSLYDASFLRNNYKYGIKFEMPLRISAGRGDYQQAKLKIEEESLNFAMKKQQVENKVIRYYNQFENLKKQITTQELALKNYIDLVKAEESKFDQGESSLFVINSREIKSLEAAEKLVELKTYLLQTSYEIQASAGILYEN